jgi:hypothetical protein
MGHPNHQSNLIETSIELSSERSITRKLGERIDVIGVVILDPLNARDMPDRPPHRQAVARYPNRQGPVRRAAREEANRESRHRTVRNEFLSRSDWHLLCAGQR